MVNEFQLFLGGRFRAGASVREICVPYDREVFARVHQADGPMLQEAVAAARRSLPTLRRMTRSRRAEILLDVRNRLREKAGGLPA
jgi:acyl-CoA reductase-like NAD-dependent aldehyde dehydrogenase